MDGKKKQIILISAIAILIMLMIALVSCQKSQPAATTEEPTVIPSTAPSTEPEGTTLEPTADGTVVPEIEVPTESQAEETDAPPEPATEAPTEKPTEASKPNPQPKPEPKPTNPPAPKPTNPPVPKPTDPPAPTNPPVPTECQHNWECTDVIPEKSHDIEWCKCKCGAKFKTQEEWLEHVKASSNAVEEHTSWWNYTEHIVDEPSKWVYTCKKCGTVKYEE